QDMMAFPLPDHEIDSMFGPYVRNRYFVVRLSIRNTTADAKLISTGMIRAEGRAIVEPENNEQPSYTVPVSIAPQSLDQIYTILDDEGVEMPRAWTFRSLEFIGALGSAWNAAFSNSLRVSKNLGLLTGVFIPEAQKLSPDRWPGYKRNIVQFAMPDLIKVP